MLARGFPHPAWIWFLGLWLPGTVECGRAATAQVLEPGDRFVAQAWDETRGLPENHISALAAGPDGRIWFVTPSSAGRLIDRRAEPLGSARHLVGLGSIAFDSLDWAWLGSSIGVDWIRTGVDLPVQPELPDLSGSGAVQLAATDSREIVVRHGASLRLQGRDSRGNVWSHTLPPLPTPLPDGHPVCADGQQGLTIVGTEGALWTLVGENWQRSAPPVLQDARLSRASVIVDAQRNAWLGWETAEGRAGLAVFAAGTWNRAPEELLRHGGRITCLARSHDASIIAGTSAGFILSLSPEWDQIPRHRVAPDQRIESLYVDADDCWWVGTARAGVLRVPSSQATLWTLDGSATSQARSVLPLDDGSMLVSTPGLGLLHVLSRPAGSPTREDAVLARTSGSGPILRTGEALWHGTPEGLMQYPMGPSGPVWTNGTLHKLGRIQHLASGATDELAAVRDDGRIFVRRNLLPDEPWEAITPADSTTVRGVAIGAEGLWLATDQGLFRWLDGVWHPVRQAGALGGARSIAYLPERKWLVAGFDKALLVIERDTPYIMGPGQGLDIGPILQVVDDRTGLLWLATSRGLVRIPHAEITKEMATRRNRPRYDVFNGAAGIPGGSFPASSSPGPAIDGSGNLFFPTETGVLRIEPGRLATSRIQPTLRLVRLFVDGVAVPKAAQTVPILHQPRVVRLRFDLGTTDPDQPIRLRYRVNPSIPEWKSGLPDREILLRNPESGLNRVEVEVRHGSSGWQPGATVEMLIRPAWYATPFAKTAGLAGLAALPITTLWIRRRRLHQRRRETLAEEARLQSERKRIARDLHDHLGNRLSELHILAEHLSHAPVSSPGSIANRISRRSIEAIELLDNLVHLLEDNTPGTWTDLVDLLQAEATGYLECADIPLQFGSDPSGPGVSAKIRQQLLAALRELLHNAVQHARPSRVSVTLTVVDSRIRLVVEDDGTGLDVHAALLKGHGLYALSERALLHGGALQAESMPGNTRIEFLVSCKTDAQRHPSSGS